MMQNLSRWVLAVTLIACGGAEAESGGALTTADGKPRLAAGNRCDEKKENLEISEYDTNGDSYPDVRKVFHKQGKGRLSRLILICREADLNGDGRKDIVRYYKDDGAPEREERDNNFDGRIDEIQHYEKGIVILQELDENQDGRVDSKTWFEDGKPTRSERDLSGRSTVDKWHPDRWEYFEKGRIVRVGTDLDGDERVDRWDRVR